MAPELQNESFGARVTVTNDVPIAVERSMYWNVNGVFWQGGTNAVGSVIPGSTIEVRIGGRAASRYRRDSMRHQDEQRDWTSRRGVARAGWLVRRDDARRADRAGRRGRVHLPLAGRRQRRLERPRELGGRRGPAGAGYPNLPGDVAVIDEPLSGKRIITIPNW